MKQGDNTMTIRQKIRLSNLLMVFIPILVTAAVVIICMKTSWGGYWHTLETMYKDENGIQSAQGLIYTYKKELWERDWETAVLDKNEKMNNLERELENMGYYILVRRNGEQLYSNISQEDMAAAQSVAGSALDTAKMLTASRKNVSVIKYTFYRGADSCAIIAVNNNHTDEHMKSYLQSYILKYILVFALLYFVMILLVNATLSWWISKSVLEPLKKLSFGANEIRDGNLDVEIAYQKDDEFGRVCRDFNEMRDYLKQSVAERLEYEEKRRELISGISHDLRTPLTSIRGYLDGLIEGIASTPQMQKRYLSAMKIRTSDLERLVDSLSEYNRLENSRFHCRTERVDLKGYIENYLKENRAEANQEQVSITFSCGDGDFDVLLDGSEFKRVLDNLFTNTVKYRKKETSIVNIHLNRTEDGRTAEIEFSDDGPGVPEESLNRIFESFYRVDSSRTHSGEGSGIGLAVVKEIVRSHGGEIRAENRDGLALVIRLPMDGGNGNE